MSRSSRNCKAALRMDARRHAGAPVSFVPKQEPLVPDRAQGAWIAYVMKLQDQSLVTMATLAGVSAPMIHMVIYGKKTSGRVQKVIATTLGFETWNELLTAREGAAA